MPDDIISVFPHLAELDTESARVCDQVTERPCG